jgi:hypothetical protein
MNKALRILGRVILAGAIVLALATAYSTVKGYTTWYFRVNGSVTVDGHPTAGYMHANTQRTVLLITRTDGSHPETYFVPVAANQAILDCGAWHPLRFVPNPVGDLDPRCSAMKAQPADVMDSPVGTTLVRAGRSIQFTTASGKKVKAEF